MAYKLLAAPLSAGLLLWTLTKPSETMRSKALELIRKLPLNVYINKHINKLVRVLQLLLILRGIGQANRLLNSLVLNQYRLSARKAQWNWPEEVILITGGCSGIGLCMARDFRREGCKVIVVDVQPPPSVLQEDPNVHHYYCDISDSDAVSSTAQTIQQQHGFVSVLVNNAGICKAKSILSTPPAHLRTIFGVNVLSHFYLTQAFLPEMLRRRKGHIVTVGSTASFITLPGLVDYTATKAAVLSFHEGLRAELKWSHGVGDNVAGGGRDVLDTVVHPSWTRTPLTEEHAAGIARRQGGPLLAPETVARAAVDQVLSCRSGALVVPAGKSTFVSSMKGWPDWMQEALRDLFGSKAARQFAPPPKNV